MLRPNSPPPDPLPLQPADATVRGVLDALRRVVRDLRVSARGAERAAGISGAQLFVLQTLTRGGVTSLSELASLTMTDQSSVSVVVSHLVEKRLVSRQTSAQDARRVELNVTAAGRRLVARCPEPTQARLLGALQRLPPPVLTSLSTGLAALVKEMGIASSEARMFFEEGSSPEPERSSDEPK